MAIDPRTSINNAVREMWGMVDMFSAKRKALLAPNLFQDVFSYSWPSDAQSNGIVDLQRQTDDRPRAEDWTLTTEAEFDRYKADNSRRLLAFTDRDLTRRLLVTAPISDQTLVVSTLDSLTAGGGTWSAVGDATNLQADSQNYVKGNGSVEYDMNAGGTTAGIQNTGLSVFDLTSYIANGSVFVWHWITTADSNITGVTLKLGTNTSNYYTRTVTTTNEGTAFQQGWNLLRFDLNGISQVGTVTKTNCTFAALYDNKSSGKSADTAYRFDHIMVKNGKFYNLIYYSKYPWQTAAGVYIENSTTDTDLLNVDNDEYTLIIDKCVENLAYELREAQDATIAVNRLGTPLGSANMRPGLIATYQLNFPSEALLLTTTYHDFASIDGDINSYSAQP